MPKITLLGAGKALLALFLVLGTLNIYGGYLMVIGQICQPASPEEEISYYCPYVLSTYYFFYTVYVLAIITGVLGSLYWHGHRLKIGLISLGSLVVGMNFHQFALNELADPRIASFEPLIVGSYVWLLASVIITLLYWAYPQLAQRWWRAMAGITLLASLFLAITGRGSMEHVYTLVGGLPWQISIAAYSLSKCLWLLLMLALTGIIIFIIHAITTWIQRGQVMPSHYSYLWRGWRMVFCGFAVAGVISYPAGLLLARHDVNASKAYIGKLMEQARTYKEKEGKFPVEITPFTAGLQDETPRLLKRYEYLAMGFPGSYYFSREAKFCFVFQDPSKPYGYYSITSDRDWKFMDEQSSLENTFLSVCDDMQPMSSEAMLGGQLGLNEPAKLELLFGKKFDQIYKEALTPKEAEPLHNHIQELGRRDPSIYGKMPDTMESLRNMIHNAPVAPAQKHDE